VSTRRHFIGGLVATAACADASRPSEIERAPEVGEASPPRPVWRAALGPVEDLDPQHAQWLVDADHYEPASERVLAVAARHEEPQQSVLDFLVDAPNKVADPRRTIVLCPLGSFPFDVIELGGFVGVVRTPPLHEIAALVAATFGMSVEVLPPRPLESRTFISREQQNKQQVDVHSLLRDMAPELPDHAYAMLVLVNADLFATPEQHYAFGWSQHRGRLGVASFARFDPALHGGHPPDGLELAIRHRAARLVTHEIAHMFGLAHCTYFRCLLAPVDVLDDLDSLAMHPCPVCQAKLLRVGGVDPIAAVRGTIAPLEQLGLVADAAWAMRRISAIV
jgi:archaemetzincin